MSAPTATPTPLRDAYLAIYDACVASQSLTPVTLGSRLGITGSDAFHLVEQLRDESLIELDETPPVPPVLQQHLLCEDTSRISRAQACSKFDSLLGGAAPTPRKSAAPRKTRAHTPTEVLQDGPTIVASVPTPRKHSIATLKDRVAGGAYIEHRWESSTGARCWICANLRELTGEDSDTPHHHARGTCSRCYNVSRPFYTACPALFQRKQSLALRGGAPSNESHGAVTLRDGTTVELSERSMIRSVRATLGVKLGKDVEAIIIARMGSSMEKIVRGSYALDPH